jgi:hypothetical protein
MNHGGREGLGGRGEGAGALAAGDLTGRIIGLAIKVHRTVGPGLLEQVYQDCLCHEMTLAGVSFRRQVAFARLRWRPAAAGLPRRHHCRGQHHPRNQSHRADPPGPRSAASDIPAHERLQRRPAAELQRRPSEGRPPPFHPDNSATSGTTATSVIERTPPEAQTVPCPRTLRPPRDLHPGHRGHPVHTGPCPHRPSQPHEARKETKQCGRWP